MKRREARTVCYTNSSKYSIELQIENTNPLFYRASFENSRTEQRKRLTRRSGVCVLEHTFAFTVKISIYLFQLHFCLIYLEK